MHAGFRIRQMLGTGFPRTGRRDMLRGLRFAQCGGSVDFISAAVTLILVMDPIGNVPTFLGYLKNVEEHRRARVVARESAFALFILMSFLFLGPALMRLLDVGIPALSIAGGVLLFLISLGLIFPSLSPTKNGSPEENPDEPFIVPLATPLLAGPSCMATLMIFVSRDPDHFSHWFAALLIAWATAAAILTSASRLSRLLGPRGLAACERLMGMVLMVISVQMLLNGVESYTQ
jgi:multiple antibiotic resistance protein